MTGIAVAGVVSGLLLTGSPGPSPAPPQAAAPPLPAFRAHPVYPVKPPPGLTTVATLRFTALRYTSPDGKRTGEVDASWYDRRSELPVIATTPGWVEVRLPQRPNGSTAWIRARDVTLRSDPYRIVIDLKTTHLSLYYESKLVLYGPAGVGTLDDPTPSGEFFVAFDEPPPELDVGYGNFILVTSAHSLAISDWDGSGDAVIGIHGPLGMDAEIGTTGARVSHGCIRLHEQTLNRLQHVPPGTPIDIID